METLTILFVCFFIISNIKIFASAETIAVNQSVRDGETIVSPGGSFELGFFSPGISRNRYLGIWYKKISTGTVVWVANRETPLSNSSGVLELTEQGNLVILNSTKGIVWSSNISRTAQGPVAELQESGNLVVRDGNDENPDNYLWQSFDYPCDTLMPGMRIGRNLVTGFNWYLSSWKSTDDPAPGEYSFGIYLDGVPQLMLKKGSKTMFRAGSWNGRRWTGAQAMVPNPIYKYEYLSNSEEVIYKFELLNTSVFSRMILNSSGAAQRFTWIDQRGWVLYYDVIVDQCDNYAFCGVQGICNIGLSPLCSCLKGFEPKSPRDWSFLEWSDGCVRSKPLECGNADGFWKHTGVKLPDTTSAQVDASVGLDECRKRCLKNCSCAAYANSDIRGSGCIMWLKDLTDMREFAVGGQDLYIRLPASELGSAGKTRGSNRKRQVGIVVGSLSFTILGLGLILLILLKLRRRGKMEKNLDNKIDDDDEEEEVIDLPTFNLITIMKATDDFSDDNKLGEGGFGAVYKGGLPEGQEIAVKRLSKYSGQGLKEFKNEVQLIAKLQHRNLVKLLGCCIHGDEQMLIYEYMPNKSLDYFIFDNSRSKALDWKKRIHIIKGIARGLLYLHEDSRLRIIHRDLKASNVLLDENMNAKISDFGLARMFGGDEIEANTKRVVGTYGYMSPEYAVDGLFSVKSDVFSFGVLVLEIVSGRKNRGFKHPDHEHNLLGHAWRLWMEQKSLELVDDVLDESRSLSEVVRYIHVALLCVQHKPDDRPSMSTVVLMLGSSDISLPQPKQPGFFTARSIPETESSSSKTASVATNDMSITTLEPR